MISIKDGISITKPGVSLPSDVLLEPPTVQWACGREGGCQADGPVCESGLYTYMVENVDILTVSPDTPTRVMPYPRYNVPCNDVETGDITLRSL